MQAHTIGFIGGGNMAEALIKGVTAATFPAGNIMVAEPRAQRCAELQERYGVTAVADNDQVVRQCDVIVLAVKPQVVKEVMPEIAAGFSGDKLLISILAGVPAQALEEYFTGSPRVVRVMPNTPALVGAGAAGISPGRFALPDDLVLTEQLFDSVGLARAVPEKEMDAVTGLSGSGPAYIYTVIEALADGGVQQGLPRDTALALAAQTVLGAAKMVLETGEHPALLRDRVCSPGGTTIAGVAALEEGGLRSALMQAVKEATRRSRELGGK